MQSRCALARAIERGAQSSPGKEGIVFNRYLESMNGHEVDQFHRFQRSIQPIEDRVVENSRIAWSDR